MDLGFRPTAGDDRRLPSSSAAATDGSFIAQALRASFFGDPPAPASQSELIRDAHSHALLEEEVRRELALERAMAARRHGTAHLAPPPPLYPERGLSLYAPDSMVSDPDRLALLRAAPAYPDTGVVEMPRSPPPACGFGPDAGPAARHFRTESRFPESFPGVPPLAPSGQHPEYEELFLPHQRPEKKRKGPPGQHGEGRESEAIPLTKVAKGVPPNNSSGTKVSWTCFLCQVKTTSEKDLIQHLQGKKHKLNEKYLDGGKPTAGGSTSLVEDPGKAVVDDEPLRKHKAMLDNHYYGRKHEARLEGLSREKNT